MYSPAHSATSSTFDDPQTPQCGNDSKPIANTSTPIDMNNQMASPPAPLVVQNNDLFDSSMDSLNNSCVMQKEKEVEKKEKEKDKEKEFRDKERDKERDEAKEKLKQEKKATKKLMKEFAICKVILEEMEVIFSNSSHYYCFGSYFYTPPLCRFMRIRGHSYCLLIPSNFQHIKKL